MKLNVKLKWNHWIGIILCSYFFWLNFNTFLKMNQNALSQITDWEKLKEKINSPTAGSENLPTEAREALEIIKKFDLKDFRFSTELESQSLVLINTIYASWPITLNPHSQSLLMTFSESHTIPDHCELKFKGTSVIYAACDR